jgi:malate dehydrogenase
MVEAIVDDRRELLPVCAWVEGTWGISGVFLGVPAILGRRGVEAISELELSEDELAALRKAASTVAERCADVDQLLAAPVGR